MVVKMLNGDPSIEEKKAFEKWLGEEPGNKTAFDESNRIWEHSERMKDFHSIDVDQDLTKVKERLHVKSSGRRIIRYWWAAAVIVLSVGLGFLARQYILPSTVMVIASTGDFMKETNLPDGTSVFLNKNSEIRYPEKFHRKDRAISFSGEGFFEVARDPERPFLIDVINQATVEVLGTSFNIKSNTPDESVNIHVLTGRVAFYSTGNTDNKIFLEKDDHALFRNGEITRNKEMNQNFLGWKTGILYFEQEKIRNVIDELGKYYGYEIILEDSVLKDTPFTSTIDNQDLESVLKEIELVLGLEYSVNGNKVTIYRPD